MNTELELTQRALDAAKHKILVHDELSSHGTRLEANMSYAKAISDLEAFRKEERDWCTCGDLTYDECNDRFMKLQEKYFALKVATSEAFKQATIHDADFAVAEQMDKAKQDTVTVSREMLEKIYSTCKIRCDKEEWNMLEQLQQALGKERG